MELAPRGREREMVITEAGQAAELESLTINLHTAEDDDNNNYNYGQEAL